jgi:hypothetical protein
MVARRAWQYSHSVDLAEIAAPQSGQLSDSPFVGMDERRPTADERNPL